MALPINSLYSLTWGDYGTSLVSAIQLLRCHGDLVDCTLAAGGRSFPAHKIVLCAASPFLFELLKNTPCKHPVVMLAGVNPNDLEALLEFVYRGEVSVDHSQLPSLLQAAHCLNIQGLAPQTVAKDDFPQIQLHQMDQEQLIATIAAPQQTVHAQVVEDMNTVHAIPQPMHQVQQTHTQDNVKDMINQLLPTRKRKPRAKKVIGISEPPIIATKIQRTDGMETVMTTTNANENGEAQQQQQVQHPQAQTVQVQHIQAQPQQIQHQAQHQQQQHVQQHQQVHHQPQQQQQQQQQPQQQQQQQTTQQITTVTVPAGIKSEAPNETIVTVTDATVTPAQTNTATVASKKGDSGNKNAKSKEPRSRSQSEQPATCPICYAVIRQSRNLRRHLELRHFAKPGVKKERKTPTKKAGASASSAGKTPVTGTTTAVTSQANTQVPQIQTVQTVHTLQTVQVKKDPDQITTTSNMTPVTVTVASGGQQHQHNATQQQQQQIQTQQLQQQQQPTAIIDQSGQITTTSANGQQQIVTQTENTDGSTSLSIAHVQTLQGHQLQLSNLNQQKNHNILVKKVFILKGNNNTQ
ncbi:transcription factor GAGA isoform X2 [Condylostylus longicornis]|uniref:transcription factor GAGA isoform X2 n=1 Tax=Condylostylus longicornis TaxID=2530218 RepID=UPI00244E59F4|nr:transcription factor GAGA isoform X2 [Condylostylus longicornis]